MRKSRGWGGTVVGISSLNDMDASENETTKFYELRTGRRYRIRLRVTLYRIEAWIDEDQARIERYTTERRISLRPGDIDMSKPFGLACWQTSAALREIKMRQVTQPATPPRRRIKARFCKSFAFNGSPGFPRLEPAVAHGQPPTAGPALGR